MKVLEKARDEDNISEIQNKENKLDFNFLIEAENREQKLGWVYKIDYHKTLVFTNDSYKEKVNGVPLGSFLMAMYEPREKAKKQAILLRVTSKVDLPKNEDVLSQLVDNLMYTAEEGHTHYEPDPYAKHLYQHTGLECDILGTFFESEIDGILKFATDVESFFSGHRYIVYKPSGNVLEKIINLGIDFNNSTNIIPYGTLKYASSLSYSEKTEQYRPVAYLALEDVIVKKTAFFGMSRTGKSNTLKVILDSICNLNKNLKNKKKIGQIVFDVNGEYAYPNDQDESKDKRSSNENRCIFDKWKDQSVRYTSSPQKALNDTQNPASLLGYNFYNNDTLSESYQLLSSIVSQNPKSNSNYIQDFLNMSFLNATDINSLEEKFFSEELVERESDTKEKGKILTEGEKSKNLLRKIALYKCILSEGGLEPIKNYKISFPKLKKEKKDEEDSLKHRLYGNSIIYKNVSLEEAKEWFKEKKDQIQRGKYWDSEFKALYGMFDSSGRSGASILSKVRPYHTIDQSQDYKETIWKALLEGKLVLIDLTTSSEAFQKVYIDGLCFYLFSKSVNVFTNGESPPKIQMYFEEAHNVFPKGTDSDLKNIYNRLAKEGAKFNIGISYSTQEISSISKNILKNTQNWFVSHLNNTEEIRELEKYYDFSVFKQSILKNSDVGYARVKTFSNKFVIPVQINIFDPNSKEEK